MSETLTATELPYSEFTHAASMHVLDSSDEGLTTVPRPIWAANPNHHLWNNHGTWYFHLTIYPTPLTKHRLRLSLGTTDLTVARLRRDFCLKNPVLALRVRPESMAA